MKKTVTEVIEIFREPTYHEKFHCLCLHDVKMNVIKSTPFIQCALDAFSPFEIPLKKVTLNNYTNNKFENISIKKNVLMKEISFKDEDIESISIYGATLVKHPLDAYADMYISSDWNNHFKFFIKVAVDLMTYDEFKKVIENFLNYFIGYGKIPFGYYFCSSQQELNSLERYCDGASLRNLKYFQENHKYWKLRMAVLCSNEYTQVQKLHLKGFFRHIYRLNILSEAHLQNTIQRQSIESWIRSDSTHGTLSKVSDVYLWEVDDQHLTKIQELFWNEYLLIGVNDKSALDKI